jgi:hypothetical protein
VLDLSLGGPIGSPTGGKLPELTTGTGHWGPGERACITTDLAGTSAIGIGNMPGGQLGTLKPATRFLVVRGPFLCVFTRSVVAVFAVLTRPWCGSSRCNRRGPRCRHSWHRPRGRNQEQARVRAIAAYAEATLVHWLGHEQYIGSIRYRAVAALRSFALYRSAAPSPASRTCTTTVALGMEGRRVRFRNWQPNHSHAAARRGYRAARSGLLPGPAMSAAMGGIREAAASSQDSRANSSALSSFRNSMKMTLWTSRSHDSRAAIIGPRLILVVVPGDLVPVQQARPFPRRRRARASDRRPRHDVERLVASLSLRIA